MPCQTCPKCGKETVYEGENRPMFCMHCGAAFAQEDLLTRAKAESDYSKKYALLMQARAEKNNDYEIEMEILLLGRLYERGGKPDFYRIPFWPLMALEEPKEFSRAERKKMLTSFFENPAIPAVKALAPSEEAFWQTYLQRMARAYVDMFIRSSNSNAMFLGFRRSEKDTMRRSMACVARLMRAVEESELVPPQLKEILFRAVYDGALAEFPDEAAKEILNGLI